MEMRDQTGSEGYFKYSQNEKQGQIDWMKDVLKEESSEIPSWTRIHLGLSDNLLHMIFLKYSLGYDLSALKSMTEEALINYTEGLKINDDEEEGSASAYIGIYENGLRLVSLAHLLNVDSDLVKDFKTFWDKIRGKDSLINALVDTSDTKGKLMYPKLFENLLKAFEAPEKERSELVQKYLENWYNTMKKSDWHDTHKKAKIGGASNYYGYWAFEAAAVTYLLDIDDSSYSDLPYYPKDLVKYAKKK